MKREATALRAIADALGRLPRALVLRQHVGTFLAVPGQLQAAADVLRRCGFAPSVVSIGRDGQPDLLVLVGDQSCPQCGAAIHPKPVEVEVKSDTGKLREGQERWRDLVSARIGVDHVVARSAQDALRGCGVVNE